MKANELRQAFLDFFVKKGHKPIPSSSLIPADPTSLFTSAGMQQFVPYLSGESKPPFKRACSIQKCLRVGDINEVGDATHHTFFEMLGNWSFGDYFKKEAIDWALEFLIGICALEKKRLRVSVFKGEKGIPRDEEAFNLWREKGFLPEEIYEFGMEDNFWGPVTKTGPCGPCSEIFYDLTEKPCAKGKNCGLDCDCGRFVEVWNLVFMEYQKTIKGDFEKMPKQNVDTGIGFERLFSILNQKPSAYETGLFWPLITEAESLSGKKYEQEKEALRVIVEHLRASAFIISAGIIPSNTDRGYILRRLLRRVIVRTRLLGFSKGWEDALMDKIVQIYSPGYGELEEKKEQIIGVIKKEKKAFEKIIDKAEPLFYKILSYQEGESTKANVVPSAIIFELVTTHGLPLEIIEEIAQKKNLIITQEGKRGFEEMMENHKKLSRQGAEKKFGGVGIDQLENEKERQKATRLHSATHLLHAALREVLGEEVRQMGSDVNPQRLRFDFSYPQKLSAQQKKEIEKLVNAWIDLGLKVEREKMPYEKALASGALAFFKERYPENVFVFSIKDAKGKVYSKEICGGPHVSNTKKMGKFVIIKEESAGAGIRRIRALLK